MDYKNKYIKYKIKYLKLKNQYGGSADSMNDKKILIITTDKDKKLELERLCQTSRIYENITIMNSYNEHNNELLDLELYSYISTNQTKFDAIIFDGIFITNFQQIKCLFLSDFINKILKENGIIILNKHIIIQDDILAKLKLINIKSFEIIQDNDQDKYNIYTIGDINETCLVNVSNLENIVCDSMITFCNIYIYNIDQTEQHSNPQTGTQSHPQTGTQLHPQTGTQSLPQPKIQTGTQSHPQTGTQSHPQSHPQTYTQSLPQSKKQPSHNDPILSKLIKQIKNNQGKVPLTYRSHYIPQRDTRKPHYIPQIPQSYNTKIVPINQTDETNYLIGDTMFTIVKNNGGGDCFFIAVCQAINNTDNLYGDNDGSKLCIIDLRNVWSTNATEEQFKVLTSVDLENQSGTGLFLSGHAGHISFEEYKKKILELGTIWANETAVSDISRYINYNIIIIRNHTLYALAYKIDPTQAFILLFNQHNIHYELLQLDGKKTFRFEELPDEIKVPLTKYFEN
jgi:hypothetical protein